MASTNHTTRLGLCQWEPEDPVLREDFNADNRRVEQGLLNAAPVTGTYIGTGQTTSQDISLGFRPSILLVTPAGGLMASTEREFSSILVLDGADGNIVKLTEDGFWVSNEVNQVNSSTSYTKNRNPYRYMAWR